MHQEPTNNRITSPTESMMTHRLHIEHGPGSEREEDKGEHDGDSVAPLQNHKWVLVSGPVQQSSLGNHSELSSTQRARLRTFGIRCGQRIREVPRES